MYRNKRFWYSFAVCVLVIAVYTGIQSVRASHSVSLETDGTFVAITADSHPVEFLPLNEIVSIKLVSDLGSWSLVSGTADEKFAVGICESDIYGVASIRAFIKNSKFILIITRQQTYICSLSTDDKTQKKYDEIRDALEAV